MPIVTVQNEIIETSAIRLARYAQIIGYDECRFWGVAPGTVSTRCRDIWTLPQRLLVAKYLAEAQLEFEDVIGYPVGARWFIEQKRIYSCPILAEVGYIIEGGIQAVSTVSLGEAVSYATEPALIGPVAVTFTDVDEVHIYHPGTDVEIDPSSVTIVGGALTIEIPRCRLVAMALVDNPPAGLTYNLLSNYETTVDIKRIYNDPSHQAILTTNHTCSSLCSASGCSDYYHDACEYIAVPKIGKIEVYKATYSSGSWSLARYDYCNCNYRFVQLRYRAGKAVDYQIEDAIVRLAHSKMPQEPCGCDVSKNMWSRDRKVPEILTAERLNCPFGTSDGAWFAYQQALSLALYRGAGIL